MKFLENKDSGGAVGGTGEIVVYQPEEITRLEVKVNEDTVWLTQTQIAQLFGVGQPAISKHLKNIFASGELDITAVHSILEYTAVDGKSYKTGFYNLDAILSIGYRVNSRQATRFRQWANTILKEYLIRGLSFNARLLQLSADIDRRLTTHAIKLNEHECQLKEQSQKIEFFIQSSLPPKQGIFFDGQIYDAYAFVAELVRKAAKRIVLIDNYIDDTVLTMLSKREDGVEAKQLNRAVKRNIERFPDDFMFQLTLDECSRCQIGTLNIKQGQNIKYLPYAFTEYGIAMLSKRAEGVEATIYTGKISKQLQLENTDAEQLLGRM